MTYLPLLLFFLMGISAFDGVAMTFFMRDHVHLSAAQLIEIGIWTQMPWSVKIAFGAVVDSFSPFGSNRRSYLVIGSILQALGIGTFLLFVAGVSPVSSEYTNLLVSGLLTTIGTVMGQVIAQTLSVEQVTPENIGKQQVANRIAVSLGAVLAACLTGYLATHLSLMEIASWKLLLPVSLFTFTIIIPLKGSSGVTLPQWKMLGLSVLFISLCVITRSQIMIFLTQMVVINYLLWKLSKRMSIVAAKVFLLSCLAIFLFRISPDVGPAFSWWTTTELHFDAEFLGHLRMISTGIDIMTLIFLSKIMAKGDILKSLTWLTIIGVVVSIPPLLVYYKYTGGIPARTIMLADTALSAPLGDLAMIPMGILLARAAPVEGRAMYMSVTASFMNMALLGGDLMSKGLNMMYTVTRTDFSQLGVLILWTTGLGIGLSMIGLVILRYTRRET